MNVSGHDRADVRVTAEIREHLASTRSREGKTEKGNTEMSSPNSSAEDLTAGGTCACPRWIIPFAGHASGSEGEDRER